MTEDPTRATARPDHPRYGQVGPADPRADPVTRPAMLPADPGLGPPTAPVPHGPVGGDAPASERPTVRTPVPDRTTGGGPDRRMAGVSHTRTGWLWTGLILSAIVLVFLLIFILQNGELVRIDFLAASGTLPTGVALLFAAIAGLLLVAIPGGLRILQLRRVARRSRR
ncbi:MAG TPA: lipopolysaccharide assembly protein LapA domain-containing protein [Pseudonocardia sp.]|jgi:uncharacterized integral membrane protein|nr:lipopolysaccharide assembly protein LapA domain-containing protein [Pseudonocardia sp.]